MRVQRFFGIDKCQQRYKKSSQCLLKPYVPEVEHRTNLGDFLNLQQCVGFDIAK